MFAYVTLIIIGIIAAYDPPGRTFDAKSFTQWHDRSVKGSRKASIDVSFTDEDGDSDYIKLVRLDLVGDAETRGFASGSLLWEEIVSTFRFIDGRCFHSAIITAGVYWTETR